MAYRVVSSLLATVFLFTILLALAEQAIAMRKMPKNIDVKQPEWLIKHDPNTVIPGIGPVVLPPGCNLNPFAPYSGGVGTGPGNLGPRSGSGGSTGTGSGSGGSNGTGSDSGGGIGAGSGSGGSTGTGSGGGGGIRAGSGSGYVPGGDDTFVPNPGFEVPSPGSGGQVPAETHS